MKCRKCRFDPWVRKVIWRRKWQPTPVFLPGKFHGRSEGSQKCWTQWVNEPFWYCMFCGLGQIPNDTYSPLYTIQYFPSPKDPCVLPIHLSPPLQFLRPLWHLLFIQISNLCSLCITRGMCHFSKNLPKPLFLENNLAVCIYYFIPIFYGCRSCILLCLTG